MIVRLLVANRGEIAVRIMRSAAELGLSTVAITAEDDRDSPHAREADKVVLLTGTGPAAYLDGEQILRIASEEACDAIHPGYGFLSEAPDFAAACNQAGVRFVGPTPDQLQQLGDKSRARQLAESCDVPVPRGLNEPVTPEQVRAFMLECNGPVMIKAVTGGGGRGIRLVHDPDEVESSFARCASEAKRSFGDDRLYVEQFLTHARHIEVQILGDGSGEVTHLGERDCSLQRRHQKLVEIAPSPALSDEGREKLFSAAQRMASAIRYLNAGTFEFLVEEENFYFLEANPRLQVEHTITEELWNVDLVAAQLRLASGMPLESLGLPRSPRSGFALQCRMNMERLTADGTPLMDAGTIEAFEPPTGPGLRIDTYGRSGYRVNTGYDSLLAKLIVRTSEGFTAALGKAERALAQFRVSGVTNNISFLQAVLDHPQVKAGDFSTRFVDQNLKSLLARSEYFAGAEEMGLSRAGATAPAADLPAGVVAVESPVTGLVVSLLVQPKEEVRKDAPIAVVEAMKMEHLVTAPVSGVVEIVLSHAGETIMAGQPIAALAETEDSAGRESEVEPKDLDRIRSDLAEVIQRQQAVLDEQRPEAVERRHAKNARTARENIAALCDQDSFIEYGSLVVAAQRARRSMEELIRRTPGDGVVVGFGNVNGHLFPAEVAQSLVIAFDETVLAGTMGEMAREKLKHCFTVAEQARRPVILFAEGGGGRAGDTDMRVAVTGWTMDVSSYFQLSQMSGLAPLVGIASGRCFAANAGMLSCCDVIIATEGCNIGVGGPAMIEGGRLGRFAPEEIGPSSVQFANGVIDLLVPDEGAAVEAAKNYLSYFQGLIADWKTHDQRALRAVVPEDRLRAYDVRRAVELIADQGSLLELRRGFGVGIVTALIRVEGRALGLIANNPLHLGGAIDSAGADKASRFMRLCEAFGLPILFLCDTPGTMVGPDAEKAATVRKMGRMFVTGANLTVPFFTIILRKAYGIGAELMAGGWFKAPRFLVSWPTGELGGMNIEGNIKLAHAAELAAIADLKEREARFDELVAEMHKVGRALSVATHNEVDDVIDPADSRTWISSALASYRYPGIGSGKRVPFVDPW